MQQSSPYRQPDPATSPKVPVWREYWYVTLMILAFVILTVSILIRSLLPEPPPKTGQSNSWGVITPGFSTINQAAEQLGNPLTSTQTSQGVESTFTSFNSFTPHQVVADDKGTVRFAKEYLRTSADNTLEQYTTKYGQPDLQLIDKEGNDALIANVFLQQGLVILAHNVDNTVEQKWYFEPTDRATFLTSWGSSLGTEGHGPEKTDLP